MYKNNLPYFNTPCSKERLKEEKMLASFLSRKFNSGIKEKFPQHYLAQPIAHKSLRFTKEKSRRYPYFCRFDVRLYYPSIDHSLLIKKIPVIYEEIFGKTISRRMEGCFKYDIPLFLEKSPYGKGLPIGSPLSCVLAGIYLLGLDLKIPFPFLRQTDDYLVFCKRKEEPEKLLKEIITPQLNELGLEINEKKLSSGKFYRDKVDFIGFDFHAGHFSIKEEKKEEFKKKITNITHLTKRKSEKAVIKLLNNKILGFGHYYKHASCRRDFKDLDAFVRMRLRRYIGRNKDSGDKEGNLRLTSSLLEKMGLKSLLSIKRKYAPKKRHISKKKKDKESKIGKRNYRSDMINLEERAHFYEQKQILKELKELTGLVGKIEKRLSKIERKLNG